MKIGIFGGTFDPLHMGHMIVAQRVLDDMKLDRILFVPATINPFKSDDNISDFDTRLDMVSKGIQDNEKFFVTGIDTGEELSYTVDTIEILKIRHPNDKLYFILGADNLLELHKWKNVDRLSEMIDFICVNRDNINAEILENQVEKLKVDFNTVVHFVDCPNIDISSTDIRNRVKEGKSIKYLVSISIEDYIDKNEMYLYEVENEDAVNEIPNFK